MHFSHTYFISLFFYSAYSSTYFISLSFYSAYIENGFRKGRKGRVGVGRQVLTKKGQKVGSVLVMLKVALIMCSTPSPHDHMKG